MSNESERESEDERVEMDQGDESWVQEHSTLSRAGDVASEAGERGSAYNTRGNLE